MTDNHPRQPDVTGTTGAGRGMVFRASAFPWRTVMGNVAFGLGRGRRQQATLDIARDYVNLVGLNRFENSYPHGVGGMQQRVRIARALAISPTILLMMTLRRSTSRPANCCRTRCSISGRNSARP